MNDYKLGYTHLAKVLRVLESCEAYEHWNLAFDWYQRIKSRFKIVTSKDRKERDLMDDKIHQMFRNKKLYFLDDIKSRKETKNEQ
jgi:hypothetical protein